MRFCHVERRWGVHSPRNENTQATLTASSCAHDSAALHILLLLLASCPAISRYNCACVARGEIGSEGVEDTTRYQNCKLVASFTIASTSSDLSMGSSRCRRFPYPRVTIPAVKPAVHDVRGCAGACLPWLCHLRVVCCRNVLAVLYFA